MDSRKIQKAGIGYTIGNYLLKGLSFLTIPIFSRLLSAADYGTYNTYMAYEGILFIFIGLALHSSFKNAKIKYSNDFNKYVSSCITLCIINFAIIMIVGNVIVCNLNLHNNYYISLLIIHSLSTAIITYYNDYVSLSFEYKKFLIVSFINAVGNIILSLFFIIVVYKNNRAYGRIFGTVVPLTIICIAVVLKFFKLAKPSLNKEYLSYALKFSLPIIPHGISQVILSQFDRIMIASMVGNAEAGIYSFAYNVYSIIAVTYSSLGTVWSPWFYEKMYTNNIKDIKIVSKKYIWGISIFTMGIMIISPEIVIIMGSKEYYEAKYITAPLISGCFFTFLYTIPAQIEYYYEKTKYIAISTFSAAILNIVLNYLFIRQYGYRASVYTTFVTYMFYFYLHYKVSKRIDSRKIFSEKTFVLVILSQIFACIFTQLFVNCWIIRWGIGIVIGIIFLIFLYKTVLKKNLVKNN